MAIAISTYAAGSIADYSDLIAEIRDMMDDADYSDAVIARAMRKAEGEFNSLLRVPDMETRATLAVTDGFAALPSDYSQLRFVRTLGDYPATLPNITAGEMGDGFAYPYGYSIEGREIRVVPAKTASISFTYYQKIPPLSEAIPANWLLTKHPSLYELWVILPGAGCIDESKAGVTLGLEISI